MSNGIFCHHLYLRRGPNKRLLLALYRFPAIVETTRTASIWKCKNIFYIRSIHRLCIHTYQIQLDTPADGKNLIYFSSPDWNILS